jgi:autoinducer 2-degrading protein
MAHNYHVAVVPMKVKEECIEDYLRALRKNVRGSHQEPGVVSFDALQSKGTPGEFLLIEVYKTPEDQTAHRNSGHFKEFKEAVGPLLREPYAAAVYNPVLED